MPRPVLHLVEICNLCSTVLYHSQYFLLLLDHTVSFQVSRIQQLLSCLRPTVNLCRFLPQERLCPFDPQEKQALLEVASLADRAKTMTAILKMAVLDGGSDALRH